MYSGVTNNQTAFDCSFVNLGKFGTQPLYKYVLSAVFFYIRNVVFALFGKVNATQPAVLKESRHISVLLLFVILAIRKNKLSQRDVYCSII